MVRHGILINSTSTVLWRSKLQHTIALVRDDTPRACCHGGLLALEVWIGSSAATCIPIVACKISVSVHVAVDGPYYSVSERRGCG